MVAAARRVGPASLVGRCQVRSTRAPPNPRLICAAICRCCPWASIAASGRSARCGLAYEFAARHPEVMKFVPCFCGCERGGHKDNHDCFVMTQERGRQRDRLGSRTASSAKSAWTWRTQAWQMSQHRRVGHRHSRCHRKEIRVPHRRGPAHADTLAQNAGASRTTSPLSVPVDESFAGFLRRPARRAPTSACSTRPGPRRLPPTHISA